MKIAGITISNPDKVLFPDFGISKAEIARYYDRIAEHILPWLKDRPLTLQRFPDGVREKGFYQKNASDYFPDFIQRVTISTRRSSNQQVVCNSRKALLYLVNQDTISFHIWSSTRNRLDYPNRVVIDLDPADGDFSSLKRAARLVKRQFSKLYPAPGLMTTGKRGLHVYFTVQRHRDFDCRRREVRAQAEELTEKWPDLFTTALPLDKRGGRIFIDYLRNAYGQTCICPFSLRPTPAASIATPIDWHELSALESGDRYAMSNIFRRLARKHS